MRIVLDIGDQELLRELEASGWTQEYDADGDVLHLHPEGSRGFSLQYSSAGWAHDQANQYWPAGQGREALKDFLPYGKVHRVRLEFSADICLRIAAPDAEFAEDLASEILAARLGDDFSVTNCKKW